jgi:glucose-6-phosphate isomerase
LIKRKYPNDYRKRIVITTDKERGFLRQVIKSGRLPVFYSAGQCRRTLLRTHDVGLLSSAFTVSMSALCFQEPARCAISAKNTDLWQNPAYLNGLLHYLFMRDGKNISVMMPYSNSLYDFADWYRQLWAESLGKRKDKRGRDIYVGQTPVKALGTTDQHSQVQLYTEGPNDKVLPLSRWRSSRPTM